MSQFEGLKVRRIEQLKKQVSWSKDRKTRYVFIIKYVRKMRRIAAGNLMANGIGSEVCFNFISLPLFWAGCFS